MTGNQPQGINMSLMKAAKSLRSMAKKSIAGGVKKGMMSTGDAALNKPQANRPTTKVPATPMKGY